MNNEALEKVGESLLELQKEVLDKILSDCVLDIASKVTEAMQKTINENQMDEQESTAFKVAAAFFMIDLATDMRKSVQDWI